MQELRSLDTTFAALADPTRRAILARLATSQTSVTELARPFSVSLPAISKHLKVLEHAGLVARKKEGRTHKIHLLAGPMKEASDWMNRYSVFWEQRLDALETYLNEAVKEETKWKKKKQSHSKSKGVSVRRAKRSTRHGRSRNN